MTEADVKEMVRAVLDTHVLWYREGQPFSRTRPRHPALHCKKCAVLHRYDLEELRRWAQ